MAAHIPKLHSDSASMNGGSLPERTVLKRVTKTVESAGRRSCHSEPNNRGDGRTPRNQEVGRVLSDKNVQCHTQRRQSFRGWRCFRLMRFYSCGAVEVSAYSTTSTSKLKVTAYGSVGKLALTNLSGVSSLSGGEVQLALAPVVIFKDIAYSSAAIPDFAPASGVPTLPLRPGTCLRNALACKPSGLQSLPS